MVSRGFVAWLLACILAGSVSPTVGQDVLFREDFDDPDLPAEWSETGHIGNRTIEGGSYRLTHSSNGSDDMFASVSSGLPSDQSIRMQVRSLVEPVGDWTYFGLFGRQSGSDAYWGGVGTNGNLFVGWADDAGTSIVNQLSLGLDTSKWINLQLDIEGDDIRLWGWEDGQARPNEPQLKMQDSRFTSGGGAGISYNLRTANNLPTIEVAYFEVRAVPEPSVSSILISGIAGGAILLGLRRTRNRVAYHCRIISISRETKDWISTDSQSE